MNAFIGWVIVVAALVVPVTISMVVVAGRLDGPDARTAFGRSTMPATRPLVELWVRASSTGPMLFFGRTRLEVHPDALVFRFRDGPLVVPMDRTGGLRRRGSLWTSMFLVLGPDGEPTSLSFLGRRSRVRQALSDGGALALIEAR